MLPLGELETRPMWLEREGPQGGGRTGGYRAEHRELGAGASADLVSPEAEM